MKVFGREEVALHKPIDPTDAGFALRGHKLRWISGIVQARRAGRIWRVLKISQLPKEVVEDMKSRAVNWGDGDTIRRKDLILAYASLPEVEEHLDKAQDAQEANESVFRGDKQVRDAVKSEGEGGKKSRRKRRSESFA